MTRPWIRLDADFASDSKLRRAGPEARMAWPHLLTLLKRCDGVATEDDLHPEALADYVGMNPGFWDRARERLEDVGLLEEVNREVRRGRSVALKSGWSTPGWEAFQPDPRGNSRRRKGDADGERPRDETGRSGTKRPAGADARAVPSRLVSSTESAEAQPRAGARPEAERVVWDAWREGAAGSRQNPTANQRKLIKARLRDHSEADLVRYFRWLRTSTHKRARFLRDEGHMGFTSVMRPSNVDERMEWVQAEASASTGSPATFGAGKPCHIEHAATVRRLRDYIEQLSEVRREAGEPAIHLTASTLVIAARKQNVAVPTAVQAQAAIEWLKRR